MGFAQRVKINVHSVLGFFTGRWDSWQNLVKSHNALGLEDSNNLGLLILDSGESNASNIDTSLFGTLLLH